MNDQKSTVKEYTDGVVTVVWKPEICSHSEKCFHGLPNVFNPNNRPWINMEGSDSERIVQQVKQCPSGALSFYYNEEGKQADSKNSETKVEVLKDGPLIVHGDLSLHAHDGTQNNRSGKTAFCRCGASSSKPFCDGSHRKINFEG
jgi:uncharacterized Fe-S cluster protein YjdI